MPTKRQRLERKIIDLEDKLSKLRRDYDELKRENTSLQQINDALVKEGALLPEGCKPGPMCAVCGFGKTLYYSGTNRSITICNKAEACPHFTTRIGLEEKES